MYETIISGLKPKMQEVVVKIQNEFKNIRTGRASTSIIENLKVSYYGTQTPLVQMASLSTPDSSTILVTPWDQNAIGDIEQSIRASDLGFNPVNDGRNLRIVLPPLTEERRKELSKMVSEISEEGKIAFRNLRQEGWNEIKSLEKDGKITEDDRYDAEKDLNKLIDDFNSKIEKMSEEKEKELMKI